MFVVRWKNIAKQELAEILRTSNDRTTVTKAASDLDVLLSYNPLKLGESREDDGRRIIVVPPLVVNFEVILDDQKVKILGVRKINRLV